jgi:hypothetical protein
MNTRFTIDKQGKNVYLNVVIANSFLNTTEIPASISQNFNTAIIDNPSLYNLILSRVSLPGTAIPLYIFKTIGYPETTDVNIGAGYVTVGYNGQYGAGTYWVWQPETLQPPIYSEFSAQTPNQDPDDTYYYAYSYQNIANMFNVAIQTSIAAAAAAIPGFPSGVDCYVTFDPNTGDFSFFGTQNMYHSDDPTDPLNVQLWFTSTLSSFFVGFKTFFNSYNSADGLDFLFLITDNNNNTPASPAGYYQVQCEFDNDFALEALSRVLITSNNCGGILAQNELTTIATVETSTPTPSFLNIMADFIPVASTETGSYRSSIQYYAQSEFFRRTLTQTTPLLSIAFDFYWQERAQPYYRRIMLSPSDSLSVTFLFERKNILS